MEFTSLMVLGLVYLTFGFHMMENPVKKINCWWGYATHASRKSQEAWDFAQKYAPPFYIIYGSGLIILCLAANFLEPSGDIAAIIRVLALGLLGLLPMIQTELQLKRRFE